jgi:septum formation protein
MNPLLPEASQRDLVLASRSPRRADILRGLNFDFEVIAPTEHVEDRAGIQDPFESPVELARLKADDVARRRPDALCIGADTVVVLDSVALGKPRDDEEARRFLESLSGRTHTVVTGLALRRVSDELAISDREQTDVRFRDLSEHDITSYVECGEGRDKAGSYAVQGLGAGLVSSIDGCFYNVVGLPVALLFDLLKRVAI